VLQERQKVFVAPRRRGETSARLNLLLRIEVESDGAGERRQSARVRLQRQGQRLERLLGKPLVLRVARLLPQAHEVAGRHTVAGWLGAVVLVLRSHKELLVIA